jgi:hypothetical protein
VVVVAYFNVREWMLRRNRRFAQLREQIVAFRLGRQAPTFVLALRRIEDRAGYRRFGFVDVGAKLMRIGCDS